MEDRAADSLDPDVPESLPMSPALGLLVAMRPRQWVKSLLVVVAPVAAGQFFHGHVAAKTAVAFVAFCVASSGTYLLNDVRARLPGWRRSASRSRTSFSR